MNKNFSFISAPEVVDESKVVDEVLDRIKNAIHQTYISIDSTGNEIKLVKIQDYIAIAKVLTGLFVTYEIDTGIIHPVNPIQIPFLSLSDDYIKNEKDLVHVFIVDKLMKSWNDNKELRNSFNNDFGKFHYRIKFITNSYNDVINKLIEKLSNSKEE